MPGIRARLWRLSHRASDCPARRRTISSSSPSSPPIPDTEPFLAPISAQTPEKFAEEIDRAGREPRHYGQLIIERDLVGSVERMGSVAYEVANRRSRIAYVYELAALPATAAAVAGWRQRGSSSAS